MRQLHEKSTVYINSSSPAFRTDASSLPVPRYMGIVNTLDKYMFHGISPQKGGKTKLAFRNPYPPPYYLLKKRRQKTHPPDALSQVQIPLSSRQRHPAAHHDQKTSRSYQQTGPPRHHRSPSSQSSAPCSSCRPPAPRHRPSPRRSAAAAAASAVSGSTQTRPCWPRAGA